MATLSKWAIFVRVFLITFLLGQGTRGAMAEGGERAAWDAANCIGTAAAYYAFLSRYPAGAYADEAVARLVELGATRSKQATRNLPNLDKCAPDRSIGQAPATAPAAAPAAAAAAPTPEKDPY